MSAAADTDEDGTVFLIDDDPGVRDALTLLLSLKGLRTQAFATAESFIDTYRPERTGCVLTDLRMPGMTGLELQAALRERRLEVPVVVLTAHGDVATARAALKNGAFDFIEKPVDDTMLLEVLRNALRVDRERRAAATARSAADRRRERLTEREREILALIAAGHQNRDVAARLGISPRTVEVHKARIMEKLECRSLAELIRMNLAAD
ncbi:MAG TPA: response regulator [Steroidobacteraceae bacterium]|nr:response regulator [Steroidobacteraceae bacterium]